MNNNIKNSFIASNKIIRYKLGAKAADILAVLIYKNNYWDEEGKLEWKNGKGYFFISLNDLIAESGFSKNVIAKNINLLKRAGLVQSIQQGLNKPNLYAIDKEVIEQYKDKYRGDFEKWQIKIRENSVSSSFIGKCSNSNSGITKKSIQDITKECSTNNKNTNNKNTNNFTNRASSESSLDLENILENMISNLRSCDDKENSQQVIVLFSFLCSMVKSFEGFNMSENDKELILKMANSDIQEYNLSAKIIANINDVNEGRKDNRFGNLFVGVSDMISNYNKATV